jgi:hypothetical protein
MIRLFVIASLGCVSPNGEEGRAPPAVADSGREDTDASETDTGNSDREDSGGADTADPDDAVGCVNLRAGPWWGVGRAFGMPMTVTLTRANGSCEFAFEEWSMQHGSVPTGGAVKDDGVFLHGPDPWPTCEATATSSRAFGGQCGAEEFEFSYDG